MQRRKKGKRQKRKKARAIKWALGCVNEYPTARCINRTTQATAKAFDIGDRHDGHDPLVARHVVLVHWMADVLMVREIPRGEVRASDVKHIAINNTMMGIQRKAKVGTIG